MTTLNWVQDENGNYEVSSAEHLKQIMHEGSLYTDTGSSPPSNDYWGFVIDNQYIQTADIDLLSDPTDIKPIGNLSVEFRNTYDGGNYSISNWSYVDPNFTTSTACEECVGLFGATRNGLLKNIRLSGVFSLNGFDRFAGFLTGHARETNIFNIVCDFDVGTTIVRGDASTTASGVDVGCVSGRTAGDSALSLTMRGIDVGGNIALVITGNTGITTVGGITGTLINTEASLIRLDATLSGIDGVFCGGITGSLSTSTLSDSINAMTGDIVGTAWSGGIVGDVGGTHSITNVVNAMTGDIVNNSASVTSGAGGITGECISTGTYDSLFNYMTGNITGLNSGGIFGLARNLSTVTKSINAMNGNVANSVIGDGTINGSVTVNTDFGLTSTSNSNGTSTALTGFLQLTGFPLPYFEISGTDTIGNSYDYEFVFANLGGNISYTNTHLIITGGVGVFQDGAVYIAPLPLIATPRATSIPISFDEVTGAVGYNVTIEGPTGGEITVLSDVTTLEHTLINLEPGTEYTIRLYADTGTGYVLEEELVTSTLANVATNYDKQDYADGGFFNLSSLLNGALSALTTVWNGVFGTGDIVNFPLNTRPEFKGTFVNLGDNISVKEIPGVILPFEPDSGTGQNVQFTLSDDVTEVPIAYDETVNTITVNGVVYFPGDSFILDGKKVTVRDI